MYRESAMSTSSLNKGGEKPTIVIVDDNQLAVEMEELLIKEYLPGRRVMTSLSKFHSPAYQAREIANNLTGPALFLVDFHMPGINGLDLIKELQEYALVPVAFMLVTGETNQEVASRALEMGVDYYCKADAPSNAGLNSSKMFLSRIVFNELHLEETVHKSVDGITGAYTVGGLRDLWVSTWNLMKRDKVWTSCLFIDVNDFGEVNNRHKNHTPGNKVLRAIEKSMRFHLRGTDAVGRMGDEFIIILPRTEKTTAVEIGERIKAEIAQLNVEVLPGVFETTSVSVGVAAIDPWKLRDNPEHLRNIPIQDFDSLMERADSFTYEDKLAHYRRLVETGDTTAKEKYEYYKGKFDVHSSTSAPAASQASISHVPIVS